MKLALVLIVAGCGSAVAPSVRPIEPPPPKARPAPRYAAPELAADTTFGTNGRLRFDDVIVNSMAVFEDDSFVLLTTPNYRDDKPPADTRLVRYTPEGVVDRSWGTGGMIRLPDIGDGGVQIDGKERLVVTTEVRDGDGTRVVVLRLLPTGAPDPSFGDHGRVTLPPDTKERPARTGVVMQPDDSFVIRLMYWDSPPYTFEARRMSESGVLAPITPVSIGAGLWAGDFETRHDGSILFAGYNPPSASFVPHAFIGALRPDFSVEFVSSLLRTPKISSTRALGVDAMNRIYLGAMEVGPAGRGPIVIARYTPAGTLDETWADHGTWIDTSNSDIYDFLPVADGTMWALTVDQDHEYQEKIPHTILEHFDASGHVTAKAPGLGQNWGASAWIDRRGRVLVLGDYNDYELHEDDETPPGTSILERFAPPHS